MAVIYYEDTVISELFANAETGRRVERSSRQVGLAHNT
jgi:hypothetical protein